MRSEKIIDAHFEVIEPGRSAPLSPRAMRDPEAVALSGRWSFVHDDLPNLIGLAAGFAALIGLRLFFHHS